MDERKRICLHHRLKIGTETTESKMETKYIKRENGYDIPVKENIRGDEKKIVIISHGLGSSKESPTATGVMDRAFRSRDISIGTVAYDFPCSGESPVSGDEFRIDYCIEDLKTVERYVRNRCSDSEICYFSSSFGAYITMLRLSSDPKPKAKAFLRSAAVNIPELFRPRAGREKELASLKEHGYFILDEDYFRPLRVPQSFLDQLEENTLDKKFVDGSAVYHMVHGENDEIVDPDKAVSFAKTHNIPITVIPRGDHQLSGPGMREKVLDIAFGFFTADI